MTLAEFTLDGGSDQTFYDISIVDGYNLPMAITLIGNANLPPNQGNPSCVGTAGQLASTPFNPYSNNQQFLGTNSSAPLPFESKVTSNQVAMWCPWDLQKSPPEEIRFSFPIISQPPYTIGSSRDFTSCS